MTYKELMDPIIRAKAELFHVEKLLGEWSTDGRRKPHQKEYTAAIDFVATASASLDAVLEHVVRRLNRLERARG